MDDFNPTTQEVSSASFYKPVRFQLQLLPEFPGVQGVVRQGPRDLPIVQGARARLSEMGLPDQGSKIKLRSVFEGDSSATGFVSRQSFRSHSRHNGPCAQRLLG
jgi:hypothetical protein